MAVFMLETDALTSAASAISSLASQVNEVSSSINGYDTSCEDGFDFAGAKSVLASNVEACSTKITNTAAILENVVSAHTELQSSMKFDGSDNYSSSSTSTSGTSSASDNSSSGGNYSGGGTSGGGYSGSGSYSSGGYSGGGSYSGGGYSGNSSKGIASQVSLAEGAVMSGLVSNNVSDVKESVNEEFAGIEKEKIIENNENSKQNDKTSEKNQNESSNNSLETSEEKVTTELKDVNYAYINSDKVTDKSKELFNDATFNYDSNTGYALVDGKYVIACDSTVGEVGDVIKFTQEDGTVVECVVGTNTVTDASKNVINFIVDKENWANKTPMSISENLINNTTNVTNAGQYNVKPSDTITTLINENTNTSKDTSSSSTPDVKEV